MNDKQFQQLMHRLDKMAAYLETLVLDGQEHHAEAKEHHAAITEELREIYFKPGCTP